MTLTPLLTASPIIQVHAWAAVAAFLIGIAMLLRRKGTAAHKAIGRIWVALMVIVAGSSFFIWELRQVGPFSWIHLLSVGTLVALFLAVRDIRRGRVEAHRSAMIMIFFGALVVAGAFTFMPGRIMHAVAFGG